MCDSKIAERSTGQFSASSLFGATQNEKVLASFHNFDPPDSSMSCWTFGAAKPVDNRG
jgi:hypothetical protein